MNVRESLVLAVRSLRSTRLRTLLTSVGIILGVAAMIFLVGLSDGMRTKFERSIGDTSRTVRVSSASPDGTGTANGVRTPLRERDARFLREHLSDDVLMVNPARRGSGVASNGQEKFRATLQGSSYRFLTTDNRTIIAGRSITKEEGEQQARVAMVGMNVVKYLYAGDINAALGSPLRVGRQNVQIVGVLNQQNDSQDNVVVMPLSTSRKFMGGTNTVTGISVVSQSSQDAPKVVDEVNRVLDQFRDIPRPAARDYQTTMFDLQIRGTNRFIQLFTAFTLGIAAISLLVGGIGVANIMFIAVKERTREIGIRKGRRGPAQRHRPAVPGGVHDPHHAGRSHRCRARHRPGAGGQTVTASAVAGLRDTRDLSARHRRRACGRGADRADRRGATRVAGRPAAPDRSTPVRVSLPCPRRCRCPRPRCTCSQGV